MTFLGHPQIFRALVCNTVGRCGLVGLFVKKSPYSARTEDRIPVEAKRKKMYVPYFE